MVSKYFEIKTNTTDFETHIQNILSTIANKNIVIYGAGDGFTQLNEKYNFASKANIVAVADKRFETQQIKTFENFKAIKPIDLKTETFDYIIITNETNQKIFDILTEEYQIPCEKVLKLFKHDIADEAININYLESFKFPKTLKSLKKKIKNKSVIIYGAGAFFELIKTYYDISDINIIGISDRRFENHEEGQKQFGYTVYSPTEIKDVNPDYVLVATKNFVGIIEDLYYETLKNTKIKIKPLMKKDVFTLIKEIWN